MTKNADINKYKYSRYSVGYDRRGSFSYPGIGVGKNVIIFGVDMSSLKKISNKKKRYFDFGQRYYTRITTHTVCRKKCIRLILLKNIKSYV